jgi:uncharacterized membrane protein
MILLSLGAVFSHTFQGGTKANFKARKFFGMIHGIGLLISFVAGFGLMARAGFSFTSGWIYIKLGIWLLMGMYPVIFYKQKTPTKWPLLALIGALLILLYAVEYKPF